MRMEVTNRHDQTTAPEGELVFHYDYAYDPAPIPAISLYASLAEGDVTPTCFTSSASVLERLAPETVERLRDLEDRERSARDSSPFPWTAASSPRWTQVRST